MLPTPTNPPAPEPKVDPGLASSVTNPNSTPLYDDGSPNYIRDIRDFTGIGRICLTRSQDQEDCYSRSELDNLANNVREAIIDDQESPENRSRDRRRLGYKQTLWVRRSVNAYKAWAHASILNKSKRISRTRPEIDICENPPGQPDFCSNFYSDDRSPYSFADDAEYLAGKGVTIGFFDSGLQKSHPELEGRPGDDTLITFRRYKTDTYTDTYTGTYDDRNKFQKVVDWLGETFVGRSVYGRSVYSVDRDRQRVVLTLEAYTENENDFSHGTGVVAAAVGQYVGIAPAANAVMLGLSIPCDTLNAGCERLPDRRMKRKLYIPESSEISDFIVDNHIDILNLSLGNGYEVTNYYDNKTGKWELDNSIYARVVSTYLQALRSLEPERRPIVVQAAGNEAFPVPDHLAYYWSCREVRGTVSLCNGCCG